MSTSHLLSCLSVACVGLFAGAMLTEGLVLLPAWRALPAADFFGWYADNGRRLMGFFGPVTWAAGLAGLAAAIAGQWSSSPGRWWSAAAAGLVLGAVATFFVYFGRANASFQAGTAVDLPGELARWGAWHWARTAMSLGALGASLAAMSARA